MVGPWRFNPCANCCCDCECEHCNDGKAPCCFKVTITGMDDASPVDCDECTQLNRTYFLQQTAPSSCIWQCSDFAMPSSYDCDPVAITLTVYKDGSDYKLKIELGADHVWEKNYGATNPVCCEFDEEAISHISSSGDCDNPTADDALVTAVASGDCPCASVEGCTGCVDLLGPDEIEVVISGMANNDCTNCTVLDGTYILPLVSVTGVCCTWRLRTGIDPCPLDPTNCNMFNTDVEVQICKIGADFKITVAIVAATTIGAFDPAAWQLVQDEAYGCLVLEDLSIPPILPIDDCCDHTSATCLITAS